MRARWPDEVGVREVALAAAALAALAALVYRPIVSGGGFMVDDWIWRSLYSSAGGDGFGTAYEAFGGEINVEHRPVQRAWLAAVISGAGDDAGRALASVVALAVAASTALYWAGREAGVPRSHAAAVAALVLVFPAAAATRLWISGGGYSLSIALAAAGLALALRAHRRRGLRAAVLHAGSLSLYAASVLTIELTAPVIALAGPAYLAAAPRHIALRRWAADLLAVTAAVVIFRGGDGATPLSDWPGKARLIADEGAHLFADRSFGAGLPLVAALAIVALIAAVAIVRLRAGAAPPRGDRAALRAGVAGLAAGALLVAAGYAALIPAEPGYRPGAPGIDDRVNAVAAIGMVAIAYATGYLAIVLTGARGRRAAVGAVAVAAALGLAYGAETRSEQDAYVRAAEMREEALNRVVARMDPPPEGSVLFHFGPARDLDTAPGVAVFAYPWDLTGALRLEWGLDRLVAYPSYPQTVYRCHRNGLLAAGPPVSIGAGAPAAIALGYGDRLRFFDARSGRQLVLRGRASCERALRFVRRYAGIGVTGPAPPARQR